MRILHVIDSGGLYGAERVVLALASGLVRDGHAVVVASIATRGEEEKPFERACRERTLDVRRVRMAAGPDVAGALRLLHLARAERADVIHSHGYKPNILLAFLPRRLRGTPVVATVHGYTNAAGRMAWYRRLDAAALRRMDRVVLVHRGLTRTRALGRLADPRWTVIENGIALERHTENAPGPRGEPGDRSLPTIGAAGRLSYEKGFDLLLEALARLADRGRRARVVILGEGPERGRLEDRAAALGVADLVALPGYVPDAATHFPSFTVFALPSRSEGLPVVLLEAMGAEVPIVACNVGGVSDVLDDGRAGLLVEAGDAGAMAAGIERLLSDPPLARTLASTARERVARCYSERAMVARYVSLYEGLQGTPREAVA